MRYPMGKQELEMGSRYLTELRDANDILDDWDALRARLREDGYLLIRGFHDRDHVMRARTEFLSRLRAMGRLDPAAPWQKGVIGSENKSAMWGKFADQLRDDFPQFLDLVNGPEAIAFFERLLGGPVITYDYKWPRAIAGGDNTGAHYDIVYMGRGTRNVYTMWTPLGDIELPMGTLAMCLGSQHFDPVKRTYGELDFDRDQLTTGWYSEDPVAIVDQIGGQWATTSFRAGDAIIFGMYMMHASLNNTTDRYRISADTRYQLASEPVDERWVKV